MYVLVEEFFFILQLTSIAAQCSRSEDPFNLQEQHCPLVYQLFAHNDIYCRIHVEIVKKSDQCADLTVVLSHVIKNY